MIRTRTAICYKYFYVIFTFQTLISVYNVRIFQAFFTGRHSSSVQNDHTVKFRHLILQLSKIRRQFYNISNECRCAPTCVDPRACTLGAFALSSVIIDKFLSRFNFNYLQSQRRLYVYIHKIKILVVHERQQQLIAAGEGNTYG